MYFRQTSIKSQIIFLLVILAVVIFLIVVTKMGAFKMSAPLRIFPHFEGKETIAGNIYYNKTYLFGISRPNTRWRIASERNLKQPPDLGFRAETLDSAHWVAKLIRYSGDEIWGDVLVAALPSDSSKNSVWWAQKFLSEISATFSPLDSLVITQNVTPRGSGIFQSAFFMVELPEKDTIEYPVMVPLFRIRNDFAIAIICRARFDTYDLVKADFEKILSSFEWFQE
ncbi:hypothetical protein B6D60_07295 [candidate division KSB1 bacterium 4484_87]|nr:MAG: hypothetical protein B6D60_07295 [candidate division KSB1 bacterium 4484_87]